MAGWPSGHTNLFALLAFAGVLAERDVDSNVAQAPRSDSRRTADHMELQMQKLSRVAIDAAPSHLPRRQRPRGQLSQRSAPRSGSAGDARHRMPLEHPHGMSSTKRASLDATVPRGGNASSVLELHTSGTLPRVSASTPKYSIVQLHASQEPPLNLVAEGVALEAASGIAAKDPQPAPAPAPPAPVPAPLDIAPAQADPVAVQPPADGGENASAVAGAGAAADAPNADEPNASGGMKVFTISTVVLLAAAGVIGGMVLSKRRQRVSNGPRPQ